MTRFIVQRLGAAAVVVAIALTASFFALQLAPGDPTNIYVHPKMSAEQQSQIRQSMGLDRPLFARYGHWLKAIVLHQDLGFSFKFNRPVTQVLFEHLPPTLLLASAAILIQFAVGIGLGVAAARRKGLLLDHAIRALSMLLYSIPQFWLGLMALLVLSYGAGWFPGGHMASVAASEMSRPTRLLDLLHHLALPALVLGLASASGTARFVRNSLIEVASERHFHSARAVGVGEGRLFWVFGLKNALGPVLQIAGLTLPFLMSGALVTEVVFSWPGMGRLTFDAILARDYPLILGATVLSAILVVLGSLLADLGHAVADPRTRAQIDRHENSLT